MALAWLKHARDQDADDEDAEWNVSPFGNPKHSQFRIHANSSGPSEAQTSQVEYRPAIDQRGTPAEILSRPGRSGRYSLRGSFSRPSSAPPAPPRGPSEGDVGFNGDFAPSPTQAPSAPPLTETLADRATVLQGLKRMAQERARSSAPQAPTESARPMSTLEPGLVAQIAPAPVPAPSSEAADVDGPPPLMWTASRLDDLDEEIFVNVASKIQSLEWRLQKMQNKISLITGDHELLEQQDIRRTRYAMGDLSSEEALTPRVRPMEQTPRPTESLQPFPAQYTIATSENTVSPRPDVP